MNYDFFKLMELAEFSELAQQLHATAKPESEMTPVEKARHDVLYQTMILQNLKAHLFVLEVGK